MSYKGFSTFSPSTQMTATNLWSSFCLHENTCANFQSKTLEMVSCELTILIWKQFYPSLCIKKCVVQTSLSCNLCALYHNSKLHCNLSKALVVSPINSNPWRIKGLNVHPICILYFYKPHQVYNILCQGENKITLICDNDDRRTKHVFASKLASKLCIWTQIFTTIHLKNELVLDMFVFDKLD